MFYNSLDLTEWSFSDFLKIGKADFVKNYKGFSSK
jgi:hypothetical protein